MADKETAKCPMCQKKSVKDYAPFCSKRCSDLDLGKWLGGEYVLAGQSPLEGIGDEGEGE